MHVTMKASISGTRNGAPWPERGETFDVPADEAAQLIANGYADPAKTEAAVAVPVAEQATATPAKPVVARPSKRPAKKV